MLQLRLVSILTLSPTSFSWLLGLQQELIWLLASQALLYRWPRLRSLSVSSPVSIHWSSVMCSCSGSPVLPGTWSNWWVSPNADMLWLFLQIQSLFTTLYVCHHCLLTCSLKKSKWDGKCHWLSNRNALLIKVQCVSNLNGCLFLFQDDKNFPKKQFFSYNITAHMSSY